MKTIIKYVAAGLIFLGVCNVTLATEMGTPEEAMALVKKAGTLIRKTNKEKALLEITNPKGQFVDRDLYIFVLDMNGNMLAHGSNPRLIGKNMSEIKDADDRHFVKEILGVAGSKGSGWVDYKWPNPVTKKIEPKTSYFEKVNDVVVVCGIYK